MLFIISSIYTLDTELKHNMFFQLIIKHISLNVKLVYFLHSLDYHLFFAIKLRCVYRKKDAFDYRYCCSCCLFHIIFYNLNAIIHWFPMSDCHHRCYLFFAYKEALRNCSVNVSPRVATEPKRSIYLQYNFCYDCMDYIN